MGEPQRHFATVHVGGTNGKGSTAAFLYAMLRAAGYRTGLYTSPHLVDFRERMVVDGRCIGAEAVAAWTERLRPPAEELGASFFEITTALAFADFAARGTEIAVVEVGLGGRLDATNVITPLVSGVTRIALEHTDYLGDSLEGIAREKAGIAKPGVPFLTTEQDPGLVEVMNDVGSWKLEVGGSSDTRVQLRTSNFQQVATTLATGYELGLLGPHQLANASLALAMARALPERWRPSAEAERAGLAAARVPGRFDRRGPWLFDVAHNPDGVRALVAALAAHPVPRPLVAVVAVLKDKDWRAMLELLSPAVDGLVLTRAPTAGARAWDLNEARARFRSSVAGRRSPSVEPDLATALRSARARAATVLVTGSFHTVGDAMALLPGFSPACHAATFPA